MSDGWRRCAGPATSNESTPIAGASRPTVERGQAYDLARDRANIRISVLSPTGLDRQIGHDGATWLDRELVSRQRIALAGEGFGQAVKAALEQRKRALASMGHVNDLGDGRVRAPRD